MTEYFILFQWDELKNILQWSGSTTQVNLVETPLLVDCSDADGFFKITLYDSPIRSKLTDQSLRSAHITTRPQWTPHSGRLRDGPLWPSLPDWSHLFHWAAISGFNPAGLWCARLCIRAAALFRVRATTVPRTPNACGSEASSRVTDITRKKDFWYWLCDDDFRTLVFGWQKTGKKYCHARLLWGFCRKWCVTEDLYNNAYQNKDMQKSTLRVLNLQRVRVF